MKKSILASTVISILASTSCLAAGSISKLPVGTVESMLFKDDAYRAEKNKTTNKKAVQPSKKGKNSKAVPGSGSPPPSAARNADSAKNAKKAPRTTQPATQAPQINPRTSNAQNIRGVNFSLTRCANAGAFVNCGMTVSAKNEADVILFCYTGTLFEDNAGGVAGCKELQLDGESSWNYVNTQLSPGKRHNAVIQFENPGSPESINTLSVLVAVDGVRGNLQFSRIPID